MVRCYGNHPGYHPPNELKHAPPEVLLWFGQRTNGALLREPSSRHHLSLRPG